MENRVARIITNSPYYASSLPLIESLGSLNIEEMIEFEIAMMIHRSVHGPAPLYM